MKTGQKNYIPGSMSFASGFMGPRGDCGFWMSADFGKAKKLIQKLLKAGRKVETAQMGLDGDWRENSMTIYESGKFTEYSCYDGSIWATPIVIVNFLDGPSETYPVFTKEKKK